MDRTDFAFCGFGSLLRGDMTLCFSFSLPLGTSEYLSRTSHCVMDHDFIFQLKPVYHVKKWLSLPEILIHHHSQPTNNSDKVLHSPLIHTSLSVTFATFLYSLENFLPKYL